MGEGERKEMEQTEQRQGLNMTSKLAKRRVVFAWDMHYSCNFRCPYCFYTSAGWTELAQKNLYKPPEEWEAVWERVYQRYGRCQLRVTAGEPFTYPRFVATVARVTKWHDVQITSNCSYTQAMKEFVVAVDPSQSEVDCTFHPLQADLDIFLKNVLLLRRYKFTANVCYLAYPPQMPKMLEYKRRFAENNIYMNMAIFWGKYKDKDYPFAYTDEEKRWIKEVIGYEVGPETVNLDPIPINGKVCGAGQRYAVIHADGKVYRCGQLAHEHQSIGNFFEPDFKLFEKGQVCTVDYCRCKEYQSAWEDEERDALNLKGEIKVASSE